MARMPLRMRLCRVPLYVVLRYVFVLQYVATLCCVAVYAARPGGFPGVLSLGLGSVLGFDEVSRRDVIRGPGDTVGWVCSPFFLSVWQIFTH